MGKQKLLMSWGDATVIEQVLTAWTKSNVSRVVVVLRRDDKNLIKKCRQFALDVVAPEVPPAEMKASVRFGLDFVRQVAAPTEKDVWLLAPADMPRLQTETIDLLLAEHNSRKPSILVPRCKSERGHPVLFPWPTAADVSTLEAHEGVNALLDRHPIRYIETADTTIRDDLDTPEDYKRLSP
jgi:CTP:molybdopterin cytidylyltransferase MocA